MCIRYFRAVSLALLAALCVAGTLHLTGCSSSGKMQIMSHHSRMLNDADSLFTKGRYEEAITLYDKIRITRPGTNEARVAHFRCGYLNIYHKNPTANWNEALEEFKSFVNRYPSDPLSSEARSWIRVLSVLKSFDTQFKNSADQVDRLKYFKKEAIQTQRFTLDSMTIMLRTCYESRDAMRDSLIKINKKLEDVIIDLEKKCQQAGR